MRATQDPETDQWDVVVIGGGPTAEAATQYASQFSGLSVVLIEHERVGGECDYWACRPSKAMLLPIETMNLAADVPGVREVVAGRNIDVPAVLARRDDIAYHYDDAPEIDFLNAHGVDLVRGYGRLSGPKSVSVTAADGTVRTISARHAVILATGSSASMPPVRGLATARPWISRDVIAVREVPRRVAIIGGGAVACEAVAVLRGLGAAEVTLIHRGSRLLATAEPFAGDMIGRRFRQDGITVHLNTTVQEVVRDRAEDRGYGLVHGGPVTLTLNTGEPLEVDELVVATGRTANSTDLGLDTVGVRPSSRGFVDVDDHLMVPGTDWLYAVGDLTGRALLTHMGKYQARVAGEVITAGALGQSLSKPPANVRTSASYNAIPQVVFTDPQIASVGLTEAQARDRGIDTEAAEYDIAKVAGAEIQREHYDGRAKIVVDSATDTLVGATFCGNGAAELLHAATVAVVGRVPITTLWHTVASFPTVSEIWLRLLETLDQQRRDKPVNGH